LLYRTEQDLQAHCTAVHHPVRERDGVLRLGEGTPVTRSVLEALQKLLDQEPLTYVPPNVVALGRGAIAWYEPAAPRVMFFRTHGESAAQRFNEVLVPQPPLVFVARDHGLRVFALREDERPTMATPLAAAPYWNVYADGRVCTGSMRLPASFDPRDTASWTASFFGSNFTHMNTGKRWSYSGTYAEMLDEAVRLGRFQTDWLEQPCTTLERALCG
jgi:PRTRC genetic system protein B